MRTVHLNLVILSSLPRKDRLCDTLTYIILYCRDSIGRGDPMPAEVTGTLPSPRCDPAAPCSSFPPIGTLRSQLIVTRRFERLPPRAMPLLVPRLLTATIAILARNAERWLFPQLVVCRTVQGRGSHGSQRRIYESLVQLIENLCTCHRS